VALIEDCLNVSLRSLLRTGHTWSGVVRWDYGGAASDSIGVAMDAPANLVTLRYSLDGSTLQVVPVRLVSARRGWTQGTFFECPGCGKRCAILRLPPGQKAFACRRCHGLGYLSQYGPRPRRSSRSRLSFAR